MPEKIHLSINGRSLTVPVGTLVAAALAQSGQTEFRRSPSGGPRGPLCGMGTCFECRVTIDGQPNRLSCLTVCQEQMEVRTDG